MNALRRQSGSIKRMSLAWRQSLRAALPDFSSRPTAVISWLNINNYSSVAEQKEEQESNTEKKPVEEVDPFGLGDLIKSDKSSVLVQGFYHQASENKPTKDGSFSEASDQSRDKAETPITVQSAKPPSESKVPEDSDKLSRLSLYDSWLKHRMHMEASQLNELGGGTESFREAHFGQIRVDSDNRFRSPQVRPDEDERIALTDQLPQRVRRRLKPESKTDASNEPIIETIEADHSQRIRASEFLKQYRGKEAEESEGDADSTDEVIHPKKKIYIHKVIQPSSESISSLDLNAPENAARTKTEALQRDSNEVPKAYLLPDFNAITHEDMWNVLKHSVIFQNDFLLAINKPSGIPVHSKARDCRHTVIEFMKKFADMAKCKNVYPLHRIDKETTGVLLFAKDPKVASIIKEKFANRQVDKVYLGVTKLCPRISEGSINIPIGEGLIPGTNKFRQVLRPDLREYGVKSTTKFCVDAITDYKVLHSMKEAAFLEIQPVTGYKHQIRVHLAMGLGCPIIGDHKYSHRSRLAPQRLHPHVLHLIKLKQSKVRDIPLHLHCNKVTFTLPKEITESTEPVYIHAKIPYFMKYTLQRLGLVR